MKSFYLTLIILSTSLSLAAQDGQLDTSFGEGGIVNTSIAPSDLGQRIASQSDGKLLVTAAIQSSSMLGLLRYNLDGSLDEFFGDEGVVTSPFSSNGINTANYTFEIALQNDGKILIAGTSQGESTFDFTLFRLNSNGSLDESFGSDGKTLVNYGISNSSTAASVLVQADGKILLGGTASISNSNEFALARLLPDGSLDSTFDTDGKATYSVGDYDDRALAMALQEDGKIILGGSSLGALITEYSLLRVNDNGSPDNSFGTDGRVITPFDTHGNELHDIKLLPDGKICATGRSYGLLNGGFAYNFSLIQYLSDGSLNLDFGVDGKVITNIGGNFDNDFSDALVVQPDGKIIVGGTSLALFYFQFAAVRYTASGDLDATFGTDGIVLTPIGTSSAYGSDIVLQNDGKLVILGHSSPNNSETSITLARYTTGLTIGVSELSAGFAEVSVYPNPVSDILSIRLALEKVTKLSFELTDFNGKILSEYSKSQSFNAGKHLYELELPSGLAAGIHYLHILSDEGKAVLKIVLDK
jgi:uncharacterized delta-60 repeat protein